MYKYLQHLRLYYVMVRCFAIDISKKRTLYEFTRMLNVHRHRYALAEKLLLHSVFFAFISILFGMISLFYYYDKLKGVGGC